MIACIDFDESTNVRPLGTTIENFGELVIRFWMVEQDVDS